MSIRARYEKELKGITDNLVLMCRYIEVAIEKCVKALTERDFDLAKEVFEADKLVDKMERDIEQSCLNLFEALGFRSEHPSGIDVEPHCAAGKFGKPFLHVYHCKMNRMRLVKSMSKFQNAHIRLLSDRSVQHGEAARGNKDTEKKTAKKIRFTRREHCVEFLNQFDPQLRGLPFHLRLFVNLIM